MCNRQLADIWPRVCVRISCLSQYTLRAVSATLTIELQAGVLVLEFPGSYWTHQQLQWLGDDRLQMSGAADSACSVDESGSFGYVVQFHRNATGAVVSLQVEGFGLDPTSDAFIKVV